MRRGLDCCRVYNAYTFRKAGTLANRRILCGAEIEVLGIMKHCIVFSPLLGASSRLWWQEPAGVG